MLIELLRPAGVELSRRWLAALLLVPEHERRSVVESIEARIASLYPAAPASALNAEGGRTVTLVHPPVQRDGYVEQVTTTYDMKQSTPRRAESDRARGRNASQGNAR